MTGGYWEPTMEWQGESQCRGLAGNSDGRAAALRDCMRLAKGGQMFRDLSQWWWWWCQGSGWCHAGVAAVGVSLGWPQGPCCSEGCPATLPGPAAGREGGGSRAEGSCSKACLFPGENHAGQRPPPRRGQQGRAWRGSQEPRLTPFMLSAAPEPLWPTPAAPPNPPGMPIPLHAVCLKLG